VHPTDLSGVACAPGRAAGRAWRWPRPPSGLGPPLASQPEALATAWEAVEAELVSRRERLQGMDEELLGLLEVQRWLLADPLFAGHARDLVARGLPAAAAIHGAVDHAVATLRAPGDAVLAARCADVQQLGERLILALAHPPGALVLPERPVVLVARDLAADLLLELIGAAGSLLRRRVRGLVLERGGPLTHTCILARQRGIPVVGGLTGIMDRVVDSDAVLLDGSRGRVVLGPDREALRRFHLDSRRALVEAVLHAPRLQLLANVDLPEDVVRARELGAEGIGLLRTDGLLGPMGAPGLDEQARRYTTALRAWAGTEVVIRLFDAPVPGPAPALGPRGARWLRLDPARTDTQIQALCAAARAVPEARLVILLPMVSRVEEIRELRARVQAAWAGPGPAPRVGAMIETPAAALDIDAVLDAADLLAVGTNDLLQLLVGASREDPRVAALLDPDHPALWRLLAQVSAAARARGRRCLLCGALAADTARLSRVAALGFDAVSVGLADLRRVRRSLQGTGVDTGPRGS